MSNANLCDVFTSVSSVFWRWKANPSIRDSNEYMRDETFANLKKALEEALAFERGELTHRPVAFTSRPMQ